MYDVTLLTNAADDSHVLCSRSTATRIIRTRKEASREKHVEERDLRIEDRDLARRYMHIELEIRRVAPLLKL